MSQTTATLLVACPDQRGLVATLANFIYTYNGNIIHADHHTDLENNIFLTRLEWCLEGFKLAKDAIAPTFAPIATSLQANWQLHFSDTVSQLAIWVSKQEHCLLDLLWRQQAKQLNAKISVIMSNHETLRPIATQFGIDFICLPISADNKQEQEAKQLEILDRYQIDLVVLAKYMQILSPEFVRRFSSIINIHHSFLPAFPGANPYHRAHERGVKIIGATGHYVTKELDEGPIIEQEVARVSHRDSVADLIRKGQDLERSVLARSVRLHLQNRVLVYNNRTVVFD